MTTNNTIIWQMEDRGSHQEPAYHDHKEAVKWHSHYGHHTRDMIQWTIKKKIKKSLEQEVSSRAGLPTFHSFLVNGIVIHLVPKPARWPPS